MEIIILNLVNCNFNVVQPANPSQNKGNRHTERNENSAEPLRGRDSKRLKLFVHEIYFMRTKVFTVGQSQPAESCECVELLGLAVSLFRLSAVRSLFARALHGATWNLRGRCVCVCVSSYYSTVSGSLSVTLGALGRCFPVLVACRRSGHDLLILILGMDVLI